MNFLFLKVSYDMLIITSLIIPEQIYKYLVNYSCGQCTDYLTETEVVNYFKIRKGHKFAASKQFSPLWTNEGLAINRVFHLTLDNDHVLDMMLYCHYSLGYNY